MAASAPTGGTGDGVRSDGKGHGGFTTDLQLLREAARTSCANTASAFMLVLDPPGPCARIAAVGPLTCETFFLYFLRRGHSASADTDRTRSCARSVGGGANLERISASSPSSALSAPQPCPRAPHPTTSAPDEEEHTACASSAGFDAAAMMLVFGRKVSSLGCLLLSARGFAATASGGSRKKKNLYETLGVAVVRTSSPSQEN